MRAEKQRTAQAGGGRTDGHTDRKSGDRQVQVSAVLIEKKL